MAKNSYDQNFSYFLFFLIGVALLANYWLIVNNIFTGTVFFFMMMAMGFIFLMVNLFVKGDDLTEISKFAKAPFTNSIYLDIPMYLLGWISAIFLEGFFGLLRVFLGSSLSTTSFSIPLFSSDLLQGISQSFAVAEISASTPWKLFNIGFNAGVVEEIVFGFALILMGILVGVLILNTLFKGKAPISNKAFVLGIAFITAIAFFVFAHTLNKTYVVATAFIIAGVFRLITIVGIYNFGLLLTFTIGLHQAINHIYLYKTLGSAVFFAGLISGYGLFLALLFSACIWFTIRNFDRIRSEFRKYF